MISLHIHENSPKTARDQRKFPQRGNTGGSAILSSTCYTKQNNKERYWIAWAQNGRVIRWESFCERLRHGSIFIIKSDQHAGLDNLSPLYYAKPHELEDIPSLALW
jgi:hypothetical protein